MLVKEKSSMTSAQPESKNKDRITAISQWKQNALIKNDLKHGQHKAEPEQAEWEIENHEAVFAYCPERVLPGKVVEELVTNDRVIGGMSAKASHMAVALYKTFVEGE